MIKKLRPSRRDEDVLKRIDAIERKEEIDDAISHTKKMRCLFDWSVFTILIGGLGSWSSKNIDALAAGFKAFWAVWGAKWL